MLYNLERLTTRAEWVDLQAIVRVARTKWEGGKETFEVAHYICSRRGNAEELGSATRGHWGIENGLHWVLDVIFREDLARFRTGDGPQNMAIIRHTVLNLLSRAKPTTSLKNRRKRAGWYVNYLDALIRQTA